MSAETIINNLKYKIKTNTAQNILRHIINALSGKKIHFYSGSDYRKGWVNLHKVPQSETAYCVCLWSKIKVTKGNDAPRGGKVGDYWETEINQKLARELEEKYIIK